MYDLIIRDATTISADGRYVADVAIKDGKIVYVGPRPRQRAHTELNAIGKFLIPGLIDTAVQFDATNSGSIWDIETSAAVTGGVTTVLALPPDATPITDSQSARIFIDSAAQKSWCHYGLWGTAIIDNARDLEACYQEHLIQGVLMVVDDQEDSADRARQTASSLTQYPGVLGLKLNAKTKEKALRTLVCAANRTDQRVHLLNMTNSEELSLLDPVKGRVNATAAVTPHHLFLSANDVVHTPLPICEERDRRSLWAAIKKGRLDCIASDHRVHAQSGVPHAPGSELLFSLMLSAVNAGRLSLEQFVSLCSTAPAEIFGLSNKGKIEVGFDADLVLFKERGLNTLAPENLLSSAGWSPYQDKTMAPKPDMVFVSGSVVAEGGLRTGLDPNGQWIGAENCA